MTRDQANTTVSDERLTAMLAGLEGVTPGPWEPVFNGERGANVIAPEPDLALATVWPYMRTYGPLPANETAAHIARCDPDTMRSILTELSARRATADVTEDQIEVCAAQVEPNLWPIMVEHDRDVHRDVVRRVLAALNPPMGI